MTPDAACLYLPWDSEFFGLRIGRVAAGRISEREIETIRAWCREARIDCLYFLADPEEAEGLLRIEEEGFRRVDERMTLKRILREPPARATEIAVHVRPAAGRDLDALMEIARTSHRNTRFYRDGHFPVALCDALYARWIEKSCAGGAARVLVAESEGTAVGYVTCDRQSSKEGQIGLFAVAERARGRGVGAAMIRHALLWFQSHGLAQVSVVTQAANPAARRAYESQGFSVDSVKPWYHFWPQLVASGAG